MLKTALFDCAINEKKVAVLTEDGAFALFFRPHPGGSDSSRVPTPGNLPSKAKKNAHARKSARGTREGGLGAGGIDWCITEAEGKALHKPDVCEAKHAKQKLLNKEKLNTTVQQTLRELRE